MKKNIFSTVSEFNAVKKAGNNELSENRKSPYFWATYLNKGAAGDFGKMKDAEGNGLKVSFLEVKKVAAQLKAMHGLRYPFDFRPLLESGFICRDLEGAFVRPVPYKGSATLADVMDGSEVVTKQGYPVVLNAAGTDLVVLRPVSSTDRGIFNLFAEWAKVDIREEEKKRKEAQKAAEKAARAKETEAQKAARKARKMKEQKAAEISRAMLAGTITPEDAASQLAALKAA